MFPSSHSAASVPSHPVPSRPVPSHPVPSRPVPSQPSLMALWMCIPGAFFPLQPKQLSALRLFVYVVAERSPWSLCQTILETRKLFKLTVARFCVEFKPLIFPILFFFFLFWEFSFFFSCMVKHWLASRWPGRKICTFSIFVLCTALLILNPIIYYLNPLRKKKTTTSPWAFTLCVCK